LSERIELSALRKGRSKNGDDGEHRVYKLSILQPLPRSKVIITRGGRR